MGNVAIEWPAFVSCYEELCAHQSRPKPTAFDLKVAKSVYDATTKALKDHHEGNAVWRTVSAPTGGGKTTAALAFIASYVREGGSALFLAFTNRDCDEVYRSLELLLKGNVAIRTTDHDEEKLDTDPENYVKLTEEQRGYWPSAFFKRSRLGHYPALIATHNGFKEHSEELLTLKDGGRRSLILVDERPDDVDIGVFDAADFEQINRLCQDRLRLDDEGEEPLITRAIGEACKQLAAAQGNYTRSQRYHRLILSLGDDLFSALRSLSVNKGLCARLATRSSFEPEHIAKAAKLILHAQEDVGQSFVHLRNDYTHGADFVTFAPDWPLHPGTVLLDATSDIDGYTELNDIRHLEPAPEADYRNLKASLLDGPRHITERNPKSLWEEDKKSTQNQLIAWLHKSVIDNTEPDEHVLVVTWMDIIESERLQALDWSGRRVDYCYFGIGVGSNKWRLCTSVFIFGDYVKPGHVTVAETHAIKGTSFVPSEDTPIRGLSGDYRVNRDGFVLRWLKQLAMRGNARHVDGDGIAKPMRLYMLTKETALILDNWARLFPTAPNPKVIKVESPETGATEATRRRQSRLNDILKFLLGSEGPEATSSDLETATGLKLKEVFRTQSDKDDFKKRVETLGWTVEFGRGRGRQTKFIKIN